MNYISSREPTLQQIASSTSPLHITLTGHRTQSLLYTEKVEIVLGNVQRVHLE